eukprot:3926506-Amphidinium_carterae.1
MNLHWLTGQELEPSGLMDLGGHSSDPQHRRCGVGYYTDTQERVTLPLPGLKQSVYGAEFLAVVRALEECHPHEVVSDCKGVVNAMQALVPATDAPFQLGEHKLVVKHADFLQCLDCNRQAGK